MASISINNSGSLQFDWKASLAEWWPVIAGLLVMYIPTFRDLANGIWNTEEQAHGPIILVVVLYLFWQKREILAQPAYETSPVLGSMILFIGLALYAVGRSQDIQLFEITSFTVVLSAILLLARGQQGFGALWFAVLFSVFMVPLPGVIVDAATGPLKQHISHIAENTLYFFGYPIGRRGVTLVVGPYQLLVADACSGLHSMFSLTALGALYLYLMQYRSWLRNGLILASILPIAFVANVIRVILLVLVTYHMGDEAGQGFLHGFAGMALFVVALISLFLFDLLLGLVFKPHRAESKS